MKTAIVNGQPISAAAVGFELDRLVRFYANHGISAEEVKKSLSVLREKALEQAIGAKLLLDRAAQLDLPVSPADVDAEVAKAEVKKLINSGVAVPGCAVVEDYSTSLK